MPTSPSAAANNAYHERAWTAIGVFGPCISLPSSRCIVLCGS
ncbi:hypothetical protein V6N13_010762 [Hibiscus sabdariffa]